MYSIHACNLLHAGFLACALMLKTEAVSSSKSQLTFNGLHSITTQKTELFKAQDNLHSTVAG
jgi:hypothetical protein